MAVPAKITGFLRAKAKPAIIVTQAINMIAPYPFDQGAWSVMNHLKPNPTP